MSADEKLSIPVENALARVQKDSEITINDIAFFLTSIALVGLFLYTAHHWHAPGRFIILPIMPILTVPILVAQAAFKRIIQCRQVLDLYKNHPHPRFELDSAGITVPIILLPCKSDVVTSCVQRNSAFLHIPWGDIESWSASYIPQDQYTGEGGIGIFSLKRKGSKKEIDITRKFLKGREKEIIDFARQFISFPPDILKPSRKQIVETWENRLLWFSPLLVIIFVAAYAYFSGSEDRKSFKQESYQLNEVHGHNTKFPKRNF